MFVKKDENSLYKFIVLKDFFILEFDNIFLINVYFLFIFFCYSEGLGLLRIRNGRGVWDYYKEFWGSVWLVWNKVVVRFD